MILSQTQWYATSKKIKGHPVIEVVVDSLSEIADSVCSEKFRGGRTKLIKQQLIKAGYAADYCVYTNLPKKRKGKGIKSYNMQIDEFIKKLNSNLREKERSGNTLLGSHQFRNKEWLYDVHWYRDKKGEDYMPCALPLVAEIELGIKRETDDGISKKVPYSAVKFDFQKLLVSNADNMVMIFQCTNLDKHIFAKDGLDDYFLKAISHYPNIHSRLCSFLFACYSRKKLWWKLIEIKAS